MEQSTHLRAEHHKKRSADRQLDSFWSYITGAHYHNAAHGRITVGVMFWKEKGKIKSKIQHSDKSGRTFLQLLQYCTETIQNYKNNVLPCEQWRYMTVQCNCNVIYADYVIPRSCSSKRSPGCCFVVSIQKKCTTVTL